MNSWKIKSWWEAYSPEAIKTTEKVFKKAIEEIKQEEINIGKLNQLNKVENDLSKAKRARFESVTSLVTRVGMIAMFFGGCVSAVAGLVFAQDQTVANILQIAGMGSAVLGLTTPLNLHFFDTFIMEKDASEEVEISRQATKSIKELKEMKKTLKNDLEMKNV